MNVMYLLIGCSLILAIGFLAAFIWSVRSGQMEDDYTPSVRILFDDVGNKSNKGGDFGSAQSPDNESDRTNDQFTNDQLTN